MRNPLSIKGLLTKFRTLLGVDQEEFRRQLINELGLTPIEKTSESDIFIVGYPKSGNTWMQNLIAGVLLRADPVVLPDSLAQELVPDVHYKKAYQRHTSRMFFKSHHLPRPEYRKVIYLVRDGRDVLVSLRHFRQVLEKRTLAFKDLLGQPYGEFADWESHVNAWAKNPFNAEVLTVSYEKLLDEPTRQMQNICKFAEIVVDGEVLKNVIEGTSFRKMQERETVYGLVNPIWPKGKRFFRRGVAGSYLDELTAEEQQQFVNSHRNILEKLGYL